MPPPPNRPGQPFLPQNPKKPQPPIPTLNLTSTDYPSRMRARSLSIGSRETRPCLQLTILTETHR